METSSFIRELLCGDGALYPLGKPEIIFGNYFFLWDEKSMGLYSNETIKFKNFIKNVIPYLETMMKMIDTYFSSSLSSSSKNDAVKKIVFDKKGLFSLTDKYNSYITFILNIDNDGSTIFFREERILINDELYNKMKNHYNSKDMVLLDKLKDLDNVVSVKWKLGDLLFNRSGRK
jgi:hypothetical protein